VCSSDLGCLPLIVQMPIFIALYSSINTNIAIREHTFIGFGLGVSPNKAFELGHGNWYYYIIPLIAAMTTFVQSRMMAAQQPMVGPMKGLMYIFPVMIFVMAINFPIALPLYWIYSNIYTITQNYFMYARSPKPTGGDEPKPNQKSKPRGKGKEARAK
jgi:YidC/Oxa1 family membrane protein insertase